jgi:hypothetical protein
VNYWQSDWSEWLPIAAAAICGRNAKSTGVSPFFLSHGWNVEIFEELPTPSIGNDSPIGRADRILAKLRDVTSWAQSAMAEAQQLQEQATNRSREEAPRYQAGDKVWLSLENIKTDRPSKKLDQKYAKYTVIEPIGSHAYRLNTPPGIHDVFHTRLLRPANDEPLPGQITSDAQPPALLIDAEEEYEVEAILNERKASGRGNNKRLLVKWKGYAKPTWEPEEALRDTAALDEWIAKGRPATTRKGRRGVM